jgi:phosphatidylglycerophosphate synthase
MEKHPLSYYTINGITLYRLLSAPLLLFLAIFGKLELFRLLLALSFLTDAVDGHLSRIFKVSSVFGAKLDSIADDATVLVATVSLWIVRPDFIEKHWLAFVIVFTLFIAQTIVALIVYKKVTSFHTYLAKTAAVFQGIFFMMFFFNVEPVWLGFYAAAIVTAVELIEEIVLVFLLPEWTTDVKGLFWVMEKGKVKGELR